MTSWTRIGRAVSVMLGLFACSAGSLADDTYTITGKAIFKGDVKKFAPKPIPEAKGSQCDNGQEFLTKSILINDKLDPPRLQNVIVSLVDGPIDMRYQRTREIVRVDLEDCEFKPYIITLLAHQQIRFELQDPFPHTFEASPTLRPFGSITLPRKGMPISYAFDAEPPFEVRSRDYPWMRGWIAVFDQPYYLVTNETGTFTFKNFPPGDYTFQAWHEVFGTITSTVSVGPDKENILLVVFEPDEEDGADEGGESKGNDE